MPRSVEPLDPVTTLRTHLRVADQAASEVVLAVESSRAALRQVEAAMDDLPRERVPPPVPEPPPVSPPVTFASPRLLRPKDVIRMVGLSRVGIWRLERDGKFPSRRRISSNAVAWLTEDVENWIRTLERGL
jgi:prophage regulatory protein